jgi:hypothetical protein
MRTCCPTAVELQRLRQRFLETSSFLLFLLNKHAEFCLKTLAIDFLEWLYGEGQKPMNLAIPVWHAHSFQADSSGLTPQTCDESRNG